jgi:uncharacterized OsmC-like protein
LIDLQPIATAFERIANMFREDPERGRHTAISRTRIDEGLTCHIEEGHWKLVADLSDKAGGARQGPTPGVLGRAALGSCIAIGYVLEAARAGVPVSSVEVEVQADYDDGALFGVSDAHPGYLEVRYQLSVRSEATEEELQRVADAADARSPYFDVFSRAQTLHRSLRVLPLDDA